MRPASPATPTRAFTLIELSVSIAVMAIVLLAMGSILVVSSRAVPGDDDPNACDLAAASVVEQIAADLCEATSILSGSPTMIEFTVPDRDEDGDEETLRFEWCGTIGDALTRSLNGGSAVDVALDVESFQIDYGRAGEQQGSSRTLASYTSAATALQNINTSNWLSQWVPPPSGGDWASAWSISQVNLWLAQNITNGFHTFVVEIREADALKRPTTTVLASTNVDESVLSLLGAWYSIPIGPVNGLGADQGVCIVVRRGANNSAGKVGYLSYGSDDVESLRASSNSGATWGTLSGLAAPYEVIGTTTGLGGPVPSVGLLLRLGSDQAAGARTTVRLLNIPEA